MRSMFHKINFICLYGIVFEMHSKGELLRYNGCVFVSKSPIKTQEGHS